MQRDFFFYRKLFRKQCSSGILRRPGIQQTQRHNNIRGALQTEAKALKPTGMFRTGTKFRVSSNEM